MAKVAWVITCLVAVFLIGPILIIIPVAFSSSPYVEFPPPGFSLRWFEEFFTSRDWMRATGVSFRVAISTVVLSVVLGTLASLGIQKLRGRLRLGVAGLMGVPLMVPSIAYALGLYLFYVKFAMNGSILGLVLAHTALAIPYVVVTVTAPLSTLSSNQEHAARSLGAHPIVAFFTVVLPLIYPGVLAGALFAFLTSFDEVIVSIFVSGIRTRTLPVLMWESVENDLDPTIAAVAVLLTAMTLLSLAIVQLVQRLTSKRRFT